MIDNTLAINAYNNINTNRISQRNKNDELLKEQTDAFEAFLVKSVLDIAMKSDNKLFPSDAGDKIYQSMYNDTMSKALSGNLGFSQLLFNFLKERS